MKTDNPGVNKIGPQSQPSALATGSIPLDGDCACLEGTNAPLPSVNQGTHGPIEHASYSYSSQSEAGEAENETGVTEGF